MGLHCLPMSHKKDVSSVGILGQVWCLIVSIPDVCPLSYLRGFRKHTYILHSLPLYATFLLMFYYK